MLRLTLEGPELEEYTSLSPGDHIKIFAPDSIGGTVMRDYTPRHYDAFTGRLDIDFALHEAGPATLWAINAKIGDAAEIGVAHPARSSFLAKPAGGMARGIRLLGCRRRR